MEEDLDEAGADINAALPDEEFPEHALPAMHFCLDEAQAIRKVHAEPE